MPGKCARGEGACDIPVGIEKYEGSLQQCYKSLRKAAAIRTNQSCMLEFKLQNAFLRNELSSSVQMCECLQSTVTDAWPEKDSALYDCDQVQQELDLVI